jgi:GNAT superfamily N-acetyltransferase
MSIQVDRDKYLLRFVSSMHDLEMAFDVLGAQFNPPMTHSDRNFSDLSQNYPQDRHLMLVVEKGGRIIGGALGFRNVLRIIALEPEMRGKGLGQRMIQTFEVCAMRHGVRMISLGAVADAKRFYERMGYRGKSSMHKELPLPGRVLEMRLKKLEPVVGDLEVGQVIETNEFGKVPSLF